MAVSTGKVIRCSASSGEKPGASVLIWTWTLVMSGVASIGRRWKLQTPTAADTATSASTIQRSRIEAAMMRSSMVAPLVVVARAGHFDVRADEEGAVGDVFGAWLEAGQDFGPFRGLAP